MLHIANTLKTAFIVIPGLLLFITSCTSNQQPNEADSKESAQDSFAPSQIIIIADLPDSSQPKTTELSEVPKPISIVIKNKPENKLAGFIAHIQNYNTDQGLALDAIGCSMKDKIGNLWFGTLGGGVSCYDGKSFTNFTTAQGLANNSVYCIAQDKSGFLWFGTRGGGLSRYDGKCFTNFTTDQGLANNIVLSIAEDKTGNLWFGTLGGGVSKYDPSASLRTGSKSFTNYTTAAGLANNNVYIIAEDHAGNIWFGTQGGGVSRYDGNRIDAIERGEKVSLADQKNLVKNDKGAFVKSFTNFTTDDGLAHNMVYSIAKDKNGNLWFGTQGGGISRYDGKTFSNFTTTQGLANNMVYCIAEDQSGNIWFGTLGGGVSCYNHKIANKACINKSCKHDLQDQKSLDEHNKELGKSFTTFNTTHGLANNMVYSITNDNNGNIWFGTLGGGISRYEGKSFVNFNAAQGLANNIVFSIAEDKTGNLWFGTYGGGVSRYDGKSFTNFTAAEGLANNVVFSIAEDKTGNIWFGTHGGGVSRYDGKSFTNFTTTQGLAHNIVFCITQDKTGYLWFGTYGGGVSRYDGNSFTNFTEVQGLANNFVYSITEDKSGNIWFGTYGGGVSKYDGNRIEAIEKGQKIQLRDKKDLNKNSKGELVKSFTNFTTAQGLVNNMVYKITEDKSGNLWFGTSSGLSLLSSNVLNETLSEKAFLHKTKRNANPMSHNIHQKKMFQNFTKTDDLPDNFITQVVENNKGQMFLGTNLGICEINRKGKVGKVYNTTTGYPVKDVNVGQNCMFMDSKGILWAGTGSDKTALVRFDYSGLYERITKSVLKIQKIKVNDENICWYNLESKGKRKNKEDTAAEKLQEFLAYGRTMTKYENNSIQKRFGNIQFDGITKFYPMPKNLVLPYEHNHISFEFAAIEPSKHILVKYQYKLEGYNNDWSNLSNRTSANFGNINEGDYTFKLKAIGANGIWCLPVEYSFKVLPPWYRTWWVYSLYAILFFVALALYSTWREQNLRRDKEKLEQTVEERTAVIAGQKEELVQKNIIVEKQKEELEKQKQRSDGLLLNILPAEVAEELKEKGSAAAKQFDSVTVMFTDFKDFTRLSEKLSPAELVNEINSCFKAFDSITTKHNIEKIKTIGDGYMCAGGLPVVNNTHPQDVVNAALEIQAFMVEHAKISTSAKFEGIRIGIHTGPVVAGIVGSKKFAYDIWGDTVNIASRMESSGEAGKVNISGSTYELMKDKFNFIYRGKILAKNKGEIDMYFVDSVL